MTGIVRRSPGRRNDVECHVECFPSASRCPDMLINYIVCWRCRILNGDGPLRNAVDRHHIRRRHHHEATFMGRNRWSRRRDRRAWWRRAWPRDGARKSVLVRLFPMTLRSILDHAVVVPSPPRPCVRQSCNHQRHFHAVKTEATESNAMDMQLDQFDLAACWAMQVETQISSHSQQPQPAVD